MKRKILNKGGKLILMALMAQLAMAVPALAASYAGNVFISTAALQGGNIAGVFSSKPNQDSTGGLVEGDDFTITNNAQYAGTTYSKLVTVIKSPSKTTYLLLKKTGYYAIKAVTLEKTFVPNITLTSAADIKYYKTGKPPAPTVSDAVAGYETAKFNIGYDLDYEISEVRIRIRDLDTEPNAFVPDSLGNDATVITGKPVEYKIGELIDGRVLQTDSDGWRYRIDVRVVVDGPGASENWGNGWFTTKALAVGIGPFELYGIYTVDNPDDPYKYALTHYSAYYIQSGNYTNCDDVLTTLQTALTADKGDYDVLEVCYWNETNQQWDVAAQWIDFNGVETRYWVNSKLGGTYEYPPNAAECAPVPFADGAYVYFGFGKLKAGGGAAGGWAGWRDEVSVDWSTDPFIWQP